MPPAPIPAEAALESRNVSKFFGDLPALRGVTVRIEPGESVLLYGPNGAGKTTLLRTLAALSRPSEGEVLFAGQNLHHNVEAAKAAIGFVSHAAYLYGELTGRENLRFFGRLFALKDLEARIDRTLDVFAVRPRADELVRNLSRGLQQRMTLARALLHDPAFLLLDEPFTGLDADSARNLEQLLARLPREGKALVFSTHNYDQGAALARRLVALERGRIQYDGPVDLVPEQVLTAARAPRS
ncbi:MAG TPA: heme ABC exporter ATP-binding protein CcmA [Terriglobia bacterium]|nr:heme ABC exporter ATP-binding protein CcmA [Terriglobia bacterium]